MAKITELPAIPEPTGAETVLVIAGGIAKRAALTKLAEAAVAPAVALVTGKAKVATDAADASRGFYDGIQAALAPLPVGAQLPVQATTRAVLAAVTDRGSGRQAYLGEPGREGLFTWVSGDVSALVAADPDQALYVAPSATPSGTAGAWRRSVVAGFALASWAGITTAVKVDQAPALNRLLALPGVVAVAVEAGIYWVRGVVLLPTGKELMGRGRGVTILKAMPDFQAPPANANLFSAMIESKNARSPRVRDLTLDCGKLSTGVQVKGVVMYRTQDFLIDRVEVIDSNSYSFWAVGEFGDADSVRPGGVFRSVRSINANVHFECSNALGVLWDGMEWSGGTGEIACEGVYHSLAGSRDITYQNGRQIGPGGGIILYVVADEVSHVDNIRFVNCDGVGSTGQVAAHIVGGAENRRCRNIEIIDCDFGSASIGAVISYADVRMVNSRLDARANEGVNATNNANVAIIDSVIKVTATSADAQVVPLSADPTSVIDMRNGRLWYVCEPGFEGTGFANRVLTQGVAFGRGAFGASPIRGAGPGGIGGKVRTILTAPHNNGFGTIVGENTDAQMSFSTIAGATYRVTVRGMLRAVPNGGGESPGVGFAAYGEGGLALAGQGRIMTARNAGSTGGAERIMALSSFGEQDQYSTVRIEPADFVTTYPFEMEAVVRASGPYSFQIKGWNAGEVQPGAVFEVERVL